VNAKRGDVVKREVALAFSLDPATDDLRPLEEKQQFWGSARKITLVRVCRFNQLTLNCETLIASEDEKLNLSNIHKHVV
jgi:hypothetical protein